MFALTLSDGVLRRIGGNALEGVTFSGMQSWGDQTLLYARQELRKDIWIIEFQDDQP